MQFDANAYGPKVAEILALGGNGTRLLPLVQMPLCPASTKAAIDAVARSESEPPLVVAGLYLYFSCWNDAHTVAQDISGAEGSYWHAIVHRQEPDAGNAGYWFRQVGAHPIFPRLRDAAAEFGVDFGPRWNPTAFVSLCERAVDAPGSALERQALQTQLVEWQLLFDYCAGKNGRA